MASKYDHFVATRRPQWERLEALLSGLRKHGLQRMDAEQVEELGRLYRLTASDLSIARRDFPRDRLTAYLQALTARAYGAVYQGRATGRRDVGLYIRYGFPAAFRRVGRYTAVCAGITFVAAAVAWVLVMAHSSYADVLLGSTESLRQPMSHHHLWVQSATSHHSVAASFIMTNNIRVALVAFAGGLLVGTLTVGIMTVNGINLGAVAALVAQYGLNLQFWSFVAPHGVIELTVIFASGGAGLAIGDAILRPGLKRRSEALVDAARTAGQVLLGCAGLLVVAGTIESFFSPSGAPTWSKFAVAGVLGGSLYLWLLGSRPRVIVERYLLQHALLDSVSPGTRDEPVS